MTLQRGTTLPPARSLTHVHLLRVVATEAGRVEQDVVRILDAGCGSSHLLEYLQGHAHRFFPGRSIEVYGFDIADHGVQPAGFFASALQRLGDTMPDIDWSRRLLLASLGDPWPFEDMTFDFVVTNQVYEHLDDATAFLSELRRVLRKGGFSANLFPVREYALEGHTGVPFAHRIRSNDVRAAYLASCERMGFDRYGPLVNTEGLTAADYGASRSDYIDFLTRYRTWPEIAGLANAEGLRATYRYTPEFYWLKLRSLFHLPQLARPYRTTFRAGQDLATFHLLKRVSSVTICFEKENKYSPPPASTGSHFSDLE